MGTTRERCNWDPNPVTITLSSSPNFSRISDSERERMRKDPWVNRCSLLWIRSEELLLPGCLSLRDDRIGRVSYSFGSVVVHLVSTW